MNLQFEKWQGCKNDFVVAWMIKPTQLELQSLQRQAEKICSRRGEGIGADGLLILHQESPRDITPRVLTIINADGTIARNCGNGLRCAALSVFSRHQKEGNRFEIPDSVVLTVEGQEKNCRFLSYADLNEHSALPMVAVEMGQVSFDNELEWNNEAVKAVQSFLADKNWQIHGVEIGNPHVVAVVDDVLAYESFARIGSGLQRGFSWDGINFHWATELELEPKRLNVIEKSLGGKVVASLKAASWERGVGPTQACGSGACAIAVSILRQDFVEKNGWIEVQMPGGNLYCRQEFEEDPVVLAGPAVFVFSGTISF